MSHISSVRAILVIGLLSIAGQASAQNIVHTKPGPVPNPVVLDDWSGANGRSASPCAVSKITEIVESTSQPDAAWL